jgi:hypothetical protein
LEHPHFPPGLGRIFSRWPLLIHESGQISGAIYVIIIGLARTPPPPSGPDKVRSNE